MTIASASEHMISGDGMPDFTRLTMSVSAKTPHFAATWCSRDGSKVIAATSAAGIPTLIMHLSIVAPVPDAHLSFIEVMACFSPVSSLTLKMMILASCPPSSTTLPTSGWRDSTAIVTALTSCTKRAPICGAIGPAPDPVMKTRQVSRGTAAKSASMRRMNSATHSGCRVLWRW